MRVSANNETDLGDGTVAHRNPGGSYDLGVGRSVDDAPHDGRAELCYSFTADAEGRRRNDLRLFGHQDPPGSFGARVLCLRRGMTHLGTPWRKRVLDYLGAQSHLRLPLGAQCGTFRARRETAFGAARA
jgi:hypothetical protein